MQRRLKRNDIMEAVVEVSKAENIIRESIYDSSKLLKIKDYFILNKGIFAIEYNSDLAVISQEIISATPAELMDQIILNLKKESNAIQIVNVTSIKKISLPYLCPFCGSPSLELKIYSDSKDKDLSSFPVIPIAVCKKCNRESIYLSDDLLKKLVSSNLNLFRAEELAEMSKDNDKFLKELRAYIVAVFGKRHIGSVSFDKREK